ncbi:MAG: hypothetical protein WBV46_02420 [Terriglobales bacterium]|jgi:hypothetical protein
MKKMKKIQPWMEQMQVRKEPAKLMMKFVLTMSMNQSKSPPPRPGLACSPT